LEALKNRKNQSTDTEKVRILSSKLGCPEKIVRHCMMKVGKSERAVQLYLEMNKERLLWQDSLATESVAV
jgi:hypothetical protein